MWLYKGNKIEDSDICFEKNIKIHVHVYTR